LRARAVRPFAIAVLGLAGLAWPALALWGSSPHGRFLTHHSLGGLAGVDALLFPAFFVAGWTLMVLAMMLHTSLPLVALFGALTRGRRDHGRLMLLLAAGYLGTWAAFGAAVLLADVALHAALEASGPLGAGAGYVGVGTLVLAGIYQFTPLKRRCLSKCRSPRAFILAHWRGCNGDAEALRLGVGHGLYCVGCCWSIMLLMFAVGLGSLGWMLVFAIAMGVEKNLPWGNRVSAPLGLVLILAGAALAMGRLGGPF
jgi:predicted metal-binding membrane protein